MADDTFTDWKTLTNHTDSLNPPINLAITKPESNNLLGIKCTIDENTASINCLSIVCQR